MIFLIQVSLHSLNCINLMWVIFRVLFTLSSIIKLLHVSLLGAG
jgi:hypothetical protein